MHVCAPPSSPATGRCSRPSTRESCSPKSCGASPRTRATWRSSSRRLSRRSTRSQMRCEMRTSACPRRTCNGSAKGRGGRQRRGGAARGRVEGDRAEQRGVRGERDAGEEGGGGWGGGRGRGAGRRHEARGQKFLGDSDKETAR